MVSHSQVPVPMLLCSLAALMLDHTRRLSEEGAHHHLLDQIRHIITAQSSESDSDGLVQTTGNLAGFPCEDPSCMPHATERSWTAAFPALSPLSRTCRV